MDVTYTLNMLTGGVMEQPYWERINYRTITATSVDEAVLQYLYKVDATDLSYPRKLDNGHWRYYWDIEIERVDGKPVEYTPGVEPPNVEEFFAKLRSEEASRQWNPNKPKFL